MAALGISRRHTLRDNQGRRSRGTSRVHGGYAGGPSRVHARAGMASERDAVRHRRAVRYQPLPGPRTGRRLPSGCSLGRHGGVREGRGRAVLRTAGSARTLPGPLSLCYHLPWPPSPWDRAGHRDGPPAQRPALTPGDAAGAARPWPSVENQRLHRPRDRPGRRPLCVRGHRNTTVYGATR
jgi:hypothetical protein